MQASYRLQPARVDLTTLARQAYFSYKGLFLWLNWPAYVSNVFLRPGLLVAMFALTGRFARGEGAAEAYVVGLTAYAVPTIIMGGVLQGFYYERSFGTLSFLFASRGSRAISYFARGVLHLPNAMVAVAAALLFSALFLNARFPDADWSAVVLCYLVMTLACASCALCWANLCVVFRDWLALYSIMLTLFLVFSGAVIPREDLPLGLGALGVALPTTHSLVALRAAFEGASLDSIAGRLALEALVGVTYALLGYATFRVVESYARRSGAYDVS